MKMDFSEKVNTKEITLREPTKLKKMNMCNAITNALDIALGSNDKYQALSLVAPLSMVRMLSLEESSAALLD